MKIFFISCFVLLVACGSSVYEDSLDAGVQLRTDLPGPVVYLEFAGALAFPPDATHPNWRTQPDNLVSIWDEENLGFIYTGASAWRKLGFDVRPMGELIDPSLTEIDPSVRNYWPAEQMKGRYILIKVYRMEVADPSIPGFAGFSSTTTRVIHLNARYGDWKLSNIAAHEVGHQLLNSGHLQFGEGVMSTTTNRWFSLTSDDLGFACAVAERCESDYK